MDHISYFLWLRDDRNNTSMQWFPCRREIGYAHYYIFLRAIERYYDVDILEVRRRPVSLVVTNTKLSIQALLKQ